MTLVLEKPVSPKVSLTPPPVSKESPERKASPTLVSKESAERKKALADAVDMIEKNFGKGSLMKMDGSFHLDAIDVVPTGCLTLDLATGVGGIPKGRIIEIFGAESSGKTTLALHVVAQAQAKGGTAAFIDAEHALDPAYAQKLGVRLPELLVSQPDSGEDALCIAEALIRSNAVDVVVVDSVAALVPKAELEGAIGDSHVGLQARLMSQAMRKLTAAIYRSATACIFINQIREKIGVMFGNPETTPGGRALKFYSSMRLDVRRVTAIKDSKDAVVGNRTRVTVVKNKVAAPFRKAEFDILYNQGISNAGCIVDVGVDKGILDKKGSWIGFNAERLGQGRDQAVEELRRNTKLREEIVAAILKKESAPPALPIAC